MRSGTRISGLVNHVCNGIAGFKMSYWYDYYTNSSDRYTANIYANICQYVFLNSGPKPSSYR